jgi:hypothetical protein
MQQNQPAAAVGIATTAAGAYIFTQLANYSTGFDDLDRHIAKQFCCAHR